jgi:uncharacterized protein (TIGR02611 family)
VTKPSSVERREAGARRPDWADLRRYGVAPDDETPPDPGAPDGRRGHSVADPTEPGWAVRRRRRARATLELIRANPTGRLALRFFVAIAGLLVVGVGLALIPLPGPGWFIVIGGLAIWAVEFHWARQLLVFTRRHVQAWTRWVGRQSLPVRTALGAVGLVFVATVVWLSLKYSFGIDLLAFLTGR